MPLPVEIRLKPSRQYRRLLLALLIVCLAAILFSGVGPGIAFPASIWTLLMTRRLYLKEFRFSMRQSITGIRGGPSGWSLAYADGEWKSVSLRKPRSAITASFMCLSFTVHDPCAVLPRWKGETLWLFNDSATERELHQLRIALLRPDTDHSVLR